MNKILLCLTLFLLTSCGEKEKMSPTVFFAGEIVNPTSEHVVLYKGDVAIDSAQLDDNNRFSFTLDSINEGLHNFYHSPEFQYVYLEKGDSLQVRLNTIQFDESLVFSGTGEDINNFLLEMFLIEEQEVELVYSYYGLEPEQFSSKIDSLRYAKIGMLESLASETELSKNAYDLAKAGIVYNSYGSKEKYPFYHKKKKGEKSIPNLPEEFYQYRKEINFDDTRFTFLRPYYNFMKYHFGNLSYMCCEEDCGIETKMAKNRLHFNRHKLKLIDSLVKQKELRDNLFRNVAVDYLLKCDTEENNKQFIDEFHKLSGNNKYIAEINGLYDGIKNIQPDNELPDFLVQDIEGNKVSLKEIAKDKQLVFYFWSGADLGHFKTIISRIAELKSKHPKYTFVGINLRTDQLRWKSLLELNQLDKSEQYWTDNFEEATHTLVVYDPNKSIIAKDGIIVDAFANVYSSF